MSGGRKRSILALLLLMCIVFSLKHYRSELEAQAVVPSELAVVRSDGALEAARSELLVAVSGEPAVPERSVKELVEHCMNAANLSHISQTILKKAQDNANYWYEELRKVVPRDPLTEYEDNHCWKVDLETQWMKEHGVIGQLGNITFQSSTFPKHFADHFFSSKRKFVCLPNIFITGFGKCGSTFLHCGVMRLVSILRNASFDNIELRKEPAFWYDEDPNKPHIPKVSDLGNYLINYLPGLRKMSEGDKGIILNDGSPRMMYKWPRFRKTEHDLTNYCLLPSILPKLLPKSKFLMITRNQADMLYSQFWYSCRNFILSEKIKQNVPNIFHNGVTAKIKKFMRCMKRTSPSSTSHLCKITPGLLRDYTPCILQGRHVLDECLNEINFETFTKEVPCGRMEVYVGAFFVHIRNWLSVVPREHFLLLRSEEVFANFEQAALDISEFLNLGVPSPDYIKRIKESVQHCNTNAHSIYKEDSRLHMRRDTREILDAFYLPFNHLLEELLQHNNITKKN